MKLLFIDMSMLLFLNSKTWFEMVFHFPTRSELLGTHYTHSQAYFKTWMDIITLFFAPEYHFITSLHVTLTLFLL